MISLLLKEILLFIKTEFFTSFQFLIGEWIIFSFIYIYSNSVYNGFISAFWWLNILSGG